MGCGSGALLDRLATVGFNNLSGADPFIAADGETPRGMPLMKRDLSEVTGEFDLIMFNHSLEHFPDPAAALKVTYEKLAAGGICLVRLPTTSSEAWSIYKADWVQIDAPRHTVIPSRQGMALAADTVGLRVEKTFDDSNLGQFMGSEAYRRDVAVTDPKILRMFGPKRIWEWEKAQTDSIGSAVVTRPVLSCGPSEDRRVRLVVSVSIPLFCRRHPLPRSENHRRR